MLSGCSYTAIQKSETPLLAGSHLAFNEYQMIGSHNSYKKALHPKVIDYLHAHSEKRAVQLNYSHPPMIEQVNMGMRHLEIDVVADPKGGLYLEPLAEKIAAEPILSDSARKQLAQPGFKVFHVPDVDIDSHCHLFSECLRQLRTWSDQHPQHLPIIILTNLKETKLSFVDGVQPPQLKAAQYAGLDQAILQGLGEEKVFTPDQLRRGYASLMDAVHKLGWPSVEQMRGKFLFIFDGNERQNGLYKQGHTALKERAMFASYEPGTPESAVMVRNDPVKQLEEIQSLVKQGYWVRTRADSNFAATNDVRRKKFEAAIESGAQVISTDFYPGSPQAGKWGYEVKFSNDSFVQPQSGRLPR